MCIAVEETNIESILVFVLLTESLVHNNVNCFSSFHTYTARKGRGTYVIRWATAFPLESTLGEKDIRKYSLETFFITCVVPSSASFQLPSPPHHLNNFEMYFWYRRRL